MDERALASPPSLPHPAACDTLLPQTSQLPPTWFTSPGLDCPPATSGLTCRRHLPEPLTWCPLHLRSPPQTGRCLVALTHLVPKALASSGPWALPRPLGPAATPMDCPHLCFFWDWLLLLSCLLACGARGTGARWAGSGEGSGVCPWAGPNLGWLCPAPSLITCHIPPCLLPSSR